MAESRYVGRRITTRTSRMTWNGEEVLVTEVYEAAPGTWHFQVFEEFHGELIPAARSLRSYVNDMAAHDAVDNVIQALIDD